MFIVLSSGSPSLTQSVITLLTTAFERDRALAQPANEATESFVSLSAAAAGAGGNEDNDNHDGDNDGDQPA